jgi:hypothetical protein
MYRIGRRSWGLSPEYGWQDCQRRREFRAAIHSSGDRDWATHPALVSFSPFPGDRARGVTIRPCPALSIRSTLPQSYGCYGIGDSNEEPRRQTYELGRCR